MRRRKCRSFDCVCCSVTPAAKPAKAVDSRDDEQCRVEVAAQEHHKEPKKQPNMRHVESPWKEETARPMEDRPLDVPQLFETGWVSLRIPFDRRKEDKEIHELDRQRCKERNLDGPGHYSHSMPAGGLLMGDDSPRSYKRRACLRG